jgi:transposase InsO family protein
MTDSHRGRNKSTKVLARRAWWAGMDKDVRNYVKTCEYCQRQRRREVSAGHMGHLPRFRVPFDFVCMDFMGPITMSERGNSYLLILLDMASRWIDAYAVCEASAEVVQQALLHFISVHGLPTVLHSDQGQAFLATALQRALETLGVRSSLATAYRPQGEPAETAVKAVSRALRALLMGTENKDQDWERLLPQALLALRATPSEATGVSPYMYLHGREMLLPVDVILGSGPSYESHSDLLSLPWRLDELRQRAVEFKSLCLQYWQPHWERCCYGIHTE